MPNEAMPQRELTRRELRELERQAERAAQLAAQSAAETPPAEQVASSVAVEPVEPVFLSRRERRAAERAAEAAALEELEAESRLAAQRVAEEHPEFFASAVEIADAVDDAPAAFEPEVELPVAARETAQPEPLEAPLAVVTPIRAADETLPVAPHDEPTIDFVAAFARKPETVAGRGRKIILENRRAASAGRFGGSMVAMSFLAGTVVLGAGSAAALGAMGANSAEQAAAHAAQPVEQQQLKVGASSSTAVSAPRSGEATAVTSIGSAAAANLATGVKLPDPTTYTNDITANVQWPFPMGVKLTDLYGPRVSPTWGASDWHGGVDFTPGEGTPIGAIADGVVNFVQPTDAGGLGVYIEVEHVINGQRVTSVYAHLLPGTATLKVGDVVNVGDTIGQVGNTGTSTGPHLHLEIRFDGNTVDPIYFLQKLNKPSVVVTLPTQPQKPANGGGEKIGVAESHALIDAIVR